MSSPLTAGPPSSPAITGQDGSYLAELLLAKGYEVHGLIRRASAVRHRARIDHLLPTRTRPRRAGAALRATSPTASRLVIAAARRSQPDEVYHLGAQSDVAGHRFDEPEYTGDVTGLGTIRLLEAVRLIGLDVPLLPGVDLARCSARPRRRRTRTPVPPALAVRRLAKVYGVLGRPATTARPTACSRSTASCSTTSRRGAVRPS